ncbi:hypothetical protein BSL78_29554 [Apostichopus japonicus]|uniref:Uncharacterized protein n=1 Tax=Stichopus japonicus TaxID=307972 RepID=A0A2G8JD06_STIJA|nr:hypothetical protein BSL78_29554 [Apostichopus japonicus]
MFVKIPLRSNVSLAWMKYPQVFFPGVTCDVHNGLYCPFKKFGFCSDFKIRYKCCNNSCVSTVGTTTSSTIPSTPSVPTTTPTLGSTTGPTRPSSTVLTTVGTTTEETTPYSTTSVTTQPTNATTTLQTTTAETTTVTEEPCLPCEIHLLPADSYTVDGCITEPISLPTCGGSCPSSYSFKKGKTRCASKLIESDDYVFADDDPLEIIAMIATFSRPALIIILWR